MPKTKTHTDRLNEKASALVQAAQELQNLTVLHTEAELMQRLAAWCDEHKKGHGCFFEVEYGMTAGKWDVTLFLADEYEHPRAVTEPRTLRASRADLDKALITILELLELVTEKKEA